MKPPPFRYERANSVEEAVQLLDAGGTVLAGGQSLIAQMAFRRARPKFLVDINNVAELARHSLPVHDEPLVLGATCRQTTLARWESADPRWAAIQQATCAIGNYVVRIRGTIGGSIAHADPAGELPAMFLLFDGALTARSAAGERVVESSQLFSDAHETTLARGELISEIRLSPPPAGAITTFRELNERTAVAGVGVGVAASEGRCTWCRIVMCGVAPTPIRAHAAEERILGSTLASSDVEDAARLAANGCSPPSDSHGSARFRQALVAALARSNLSNIIRQLNANTR